MAERKAMSLRECAEYEKQRNLDAGGAANRLSAWGRISKARAERGVSRKARRARRAAQGGAR